MTESLIIPPNTIRAHVVDGVNIVVEDHIRPSPCKNRLAPISLYRKLENE